ncbi:Protein kinase superfamily protein [Euphorbia peplus]|nr:Protein kinase superfamily protein [Euphorbia peplus]
MKLGFTQNDLDESSPGQSLDESFRHSSSAISVRSISNSSTSSKFNPNSKRVFKALKDYRRKLIDFELFKQDIEDWVLEHLNADSFNEEQSFRSPFSIDELCKLDLALEGVLFQQLCRMPCVPHASDDSLEEQYFAMEDFLHASMNGLWRTFWHKSGPLPFFISCPYRVGSKFYSVEKAISRRSLEDLSGLALISKSRSEPQAHWGQVMELALFRPDILSGNGLKLSSSCICEALFYGIHILISRSLSTVDTVGNDSVVLLVFDSKFGGVVKLGGDISRLDLQSTDPYQSAIEWVKFHAEIEVSSVDRVWNKLGNPNWGDLGTLQVLLATFYSIVQQNGPPRRSIASLAADHNLRLQKRRIECCHGESEHSLVPFQRSGHEGEIVELEQSDDGKKASRLKLRLGEVLTLDDQLQGHKSFQIQETLVGGNSYLYTAVSLDYPKELLTLYAGAHPCRLESSWEDMSLWYRVQRQTKVLNTLKQQGITSKHLPEIVASGRILHSGACKRQTPGGRCDHPWCGTPILVTSLVGEPLSFTVAQNSKFSPEEALRCCRDCLAALRSAAIGGVLHGDISPENVICVMDPKGARNRFNYVLISWGRAVLEDRDSPAINLQFSSSHALQHGKLCPSSDAESLVYLLFLVCGGNMQQQDSIESALQWRERSWAKRLIQQKLGEVSALLKAFADYIDSLCGTPYPVDYEIWLKRLNKAVDGLGDRGKMVDEFEAITLRLEDVAQSSGTL